MKRQPAGNPKGGQFAEDRKPEGGDLTSVCPKCGGEVRELPAYNPADRSDPFPSRTVSSCANCGHEPSTGNTAAHLELAERLNTVHEMWREFDSGEQLSKDDFAIIYRTLDDTDRALGGDDSDPASTSAGNKELADKIDDVHHLILNFDQDSIPLSRDDFDYIYEAIEGAREALGSGGPHGSSPGQYCLKCDRYTGSSEDVCAGCGSDMMTAVSAVDKERLVNIIRDEFGTPDKEPTHLLPVGGGFELLANSGFEEDDSNRHPDDSAWDGIFNIGAASFYVSNDGQGHPNRYVAKGIPAASQDTVIGSYTDAILRGFQGLERSDALDTFCSLVKVIEDNS